jgi:uncharacterized protein with HEPN domain
MIGYSDEISEAIELFGNSFEALSNSKTYKNATAMCILQIGELAGHLSDGFKSKHPEMPWREMKDMRNIAAHGYGNFDINKLWETITEDIPALRDYCNRIIQEK